MTKPDLSVVILCYHAGNKIHIFLNKVIQDISGVTSNWEIVLVGNYNPGEADETPQVVQDIAKQNPKIKAVTLPKQGWMG